MDSVSATTASSVISHVPDSSSAPPKRALRSVTNLALPSTCPISTSPSLKRDPRNPTKSPYFSTGPETMVGRIPRGCPTTKWPATAEGRFGLIQEELVGNPFQVLLVTIFLNRTTGRKAIPVFRQFINDYPTPDAICTAPQEDLESYFLNLGLTKRANQVRNLAASWIEQRPAAGITTKPKYKYPAPKKPFPPEFFAEPLGVPQGSEFEIGHLKGIGQYGMDSWRIFCRDALLGREDQEWRCVVPDDKELRSYVRWRWAMEGKYWVEKDDEWIEGLGVQRMRNATVFLA